MVRYSHGSLTAIKKALKSRQSFFYFILLFSRACFAVSFQWQNRLNPAISSRLITSIVQKLTGTKIITAIPHPNTNNANPPSCFISHQPHRLICHAVNPPAGSSEAEICSCDLLYAAAAANCIFIFLHQQLSLLLHPKPLLYALFR